MGALSVDMQPYSCFIEKFEEGKDIYCSVDVAWEDLSKHVSLFESKVAPIPGDGYCMLESMRYSLEQDYDEKSKEFKEKIKVELYEV